MPKHPLVEGLRALLTLPRPAQIPAALALAEELSRHAPDEEWNTSFGPGSLFEAWTETRVTRGIYAANADALRPVVARAGFRVIEVGGGDGRLWSLLPDAAEGELLLIDPAAEAHERVAAALPPGVRLRSEVCGVEEAQLAPADAIVCSLTLHHLAGQDAAERRRYGFEGPGKLEVLESMREALAPRGGLLLLNEADVYCDLQLAPGDPLLADHLADSYLRRCGQALLDELDALSADGDPERRGPRVLAILHRWCLDQLRMAELPREARDVYELDVFRWLSLLERAGFEVIARGFTDDYGLFYRYVCRPASP